MTTLNRAEVVRRHLAAKRAAEVYRMMLDADASAEYAEQGTAPSWRGSDFTVTTAVKSGGPAVVDDTALLEWVRKVHPDEVETVERVRPAFVTALLASASRMGECCEPDGTVIDGMAWRVGGEFSHIAIKPAASLKSQLDEFGAAIEAGTVVFPLPQITAAAEAEPEFAADYDPWAVTGPADLTALTAWTAPDPWAGESA